MQPLSIQPGRCDGCFPGEGGQWRDINTLFYLKCQGKLWPVREKWRRFCCQEQYLKSSTNKDIGGYG